VYGRIKNIQGAQADFVDVPVVVLCVCFFREVWRERERERERERKREDDVHVLRQNIL
jgi:hypothetical protein